MSKVIEEAKGRFDRNTSIDGWPITDNGKMLTQQQILELLINFRKELESKNKEIDDLKAKCFMLEKGKYGVEYYAGKIMRLKINDSSQKSDIKELNKEIERYKAVVDKSDVLVRDWIHGGIHIEKCVRKLDEALSNLKEQDNE